MLAPERGRHAGGGRSRPRSSQGQHRVFARRQFSSLPGLEEAQEGFVSLS